ncbi:Two-component system sensor histidine kinase [hydrothermal vent metagenome]|uniref:histidine kinase n=1 Tax=hydrothermal vent metagenome TaxID=652676 RepID=A0A3B1C6Z5_9ZZZZ
MNLGLFSYLSASLAFVLFTVLLLTSWRGGGRGVLLAGVSLINAVWAALASQVAIGAVEQASAYQALEVVRYLAWYVFLIKLLDSAASKNPAYLKFQRRALSFSVGFGCFLLLLVFVSPYLDRWHFHRDLMTFQLVGHLILSIIGLTIIEQLFRNIAVRHRWSVKYLFIGVGGIFAYDFYFYANALLFRGMDPGLWGARGFISLILVPLLVLSAARNREWSLNVFVSRDIVLTTTAILGGGFYLLMMAGVGYYLRDFGGSWGRVAQIVFFSLAIILLLAVLFSGQLRANLRVFLGKHFYNNKYDYRKEWLQLTGELSNQKDDSNGFISATRVLARLVDARASLLWLRENNNRYRNITAWHTDKLDATETEAGSLVQFFEQKGYIVNLTNMDAHPEEYQGLVLPAWLSEIHRPWLIVPLFGLESLLGFAVLADPLVSREINWEDRDLLKTAAKQVSSYLTVLKTSEVLAEARQFEVFNRISAYMVHDLKNISAELELIVRNAERHRNNPEFLDDTFATINNASVDIKKLLDQLRNKQLQREKKVVVDVCELVLEVARHKNNYLPVPDVECDCSDCHTVVEKRRFGNVLGHLVDNGQQATPDDGFLHVKVRKRIPFVVVQIVDNGHGMDDDFINKRLFKPFDTTKGNAGMGIGMYECREFIHELGGEIKVESKPGEGTSISLHIPLHN